MSLKLLHISDIHFKDFKDHEYLDLDKEIQREIEFDLASLKAHYGKIDTVLIGGDIAFSGSESEYNIADDWLKKICEIIDCKEENVLTVPGNHDVERQKIAPFLKEIQKQLKGLKPRSALDSKIIEYITNAESSEMLLRPLQNYTEFAQKYGAIPDNNNKLFWEKDLALDRQVLRIRGVNSALVSSNLDDEDTSKLILGSHQTSFLREKGVVYLLLCHHPPEWILDGNEAFKDFKSKVRIQLFGHKHSFGTDIYNGTSLVLAAGAMQPSRSESEWEPRYNILDISTERIEDKVKLKVKVYRRVLDRNSKKFKSDWTEEGKIYEEFQLNLTDEEAADYISIPTTRLGQANETMGASKPIIDPNVPNPKRALAFQFLGLPYHSKLKIAVELNLIDDTDKDLLEVQKAQVYFKRAAERNLLAELWDEVQKTLATTQNNPFR